MKKSPMVLVFLTLAIAALFLCGQQAFAANHHWVVKNVPHSANPDGVGPAPAGFFAAGAALVNTPLNQPGDPFTGPWPGTNYPTGAPNDFWPCFGGDGTGQPDCAYIGSTGTSDGASVVGSAVLGTPSYTWYLDANTTTSQPYGCNATTAGDEFKFCAQLDNWYEDDSGDTTDDLVWEATVTQKQGSSTVYLYDSGEQDYGPNPYGGLLAADGVAPVIIFYEDLNFGLLGGSGAPTANNNGPCWGDYQYPIPANYTYGEFNTFAADFGIAGKETCVAPADGPATVTITTELLPATYTTVSNPKDYAKDCPGMTGAELPCTTVKYGKATYSVKQTFTIFFR
jgi:hypothetical protein